MALSRARQILRYRACEEQDHDDGGRDPEGAVEVRIAVQHVEEVGVGECDGAAAAQDFACVDVEELAVEGYGPEIVF